MNVRRIGKLSEEKKLFYIFLIIHLVVWTCVGLIRTVLPTDTLEGIYWGSLHDFGTPKHPMFAGWISYLAYLPFKKDICLYLVSQIFVVAGLIYIYKLAKCFFDDKKAMLSTIVLEGCWSYSYITGYYGFNPDVVFLFILPLIAYIFYNCMEYSKPSDWLKLGFVVGISFLDKYQTALLILPMLIWAIMFKREIFKDKWFYISILVAFIVFLPHLIWLIKYDFFSLIYFEDELSATSWTKHIIAPLIFILSQLAVTIGSVLIFLIAKLRFKSEFKLNKNMNKKDVYFILLLGFLPIILHIFMGIFAGSMRGRWGYEFWFMLGIASFYFFPIKIETKEFKFILKIAYIVMFIIFVVLSTLLSVEKNYRSRYPVVTLYGDMQNFWHKKYNTPIKYIGGYIEWSLPIAIYGNNHPKAILDTHGYKDPWLDQEDIKKSGVLIIGRKPEDVIYYTYISCPYLPGNYKINPIEYKFFVHNAFNMKREYTIYYFIVPPKQI